ncbi:MAG: nitrous oxide-stimulated promoter family protein, partial [Dorea sp.]|nr:nitrous oxide-stimulated promoter family protein [Dorea sp.]
SEKREREKAVVSQMIALYCRKRHHGKDGLCPKWNILRIPSAPPPALPAGIRRSSGYSVPCISSNPPNQAPSHRKCAAERNNHEYF